MTLYVEVSLLSYTIFIVTATTVTSRGPFHFYSPREKHRVIAGYRLNLESMENQFMVAVAFHTENCHLNTETLDGACLFSCTGSIISARWVISASHCLGRQARIDAKVKQQRGQKSHCVAEIEKGIKSPIKGIYCQINQYGDLEIFPKHVKSYVFVKVNDFEKEYKNLTHYSIKRLIIPQDAYRGGGYKVNVHKEFQA